MEPSSATPALEAGNSTSITVACAGLHPAGQLLGVACAPPAGTQGTALMLQGRPSMRVPGCIAPHGSLMTSARVTAALLGK
jgi:hypothetical protein